MSNIMENITTEDLEIENSGFELPTEITGNPIIDTVIEVAAGVILVEVCEWGLGKLFNFGKEKIEAAKATEEKPEDKKDEKK